MECQSSKGTPLDSPMRRSEVTFAKSVWVEWWGMASKQSWFGSDWGDEDAEIERVVVPEVLKSRNNLRLVDP